MSIFKCKICGGSLEFSEGSTVALCQYCGTKQTLPKISDGNNSTLYERADHFRRNNDFDKAISIYEQILNADNTDAEAYWSLVLCRYGIEYVEDPKSNKRIATVNRMQYTSVLADEDYKSALKYADSEQKEIYEAEAREIDSIQKGILAISQKEEPFDVFICYKETDNSGRRTPDSVLANELYHQLDNEGYKVFFSRITLEDKLGTAYEPYIFAALNSAKVMVVIGTKPEYFNAVWVRNEWSRFLALIKNGANKVLIPAYRDMDPYDLPEEFSHLQAQDMSKLGFMQDLIRGIEKLTSASKPKYVKEQPVQSGANIAPLLRRVYLFLEDGDWSSADEYCEKVLDLEPECGEAYLGKLMIDLKIRRREKLSEQTEPFDNNPYYQKALRFGDAKLQNELEGYISTIKNRAERERLLAIYNKGEMLLKSAKTQEDFLNASRVFASINGFEDSETKARLCEEKANEIHFSALYSAATMLMKAAKSEEDYAKASDAFSKIKEYKDSEKLAEECANKADNINKTAIYNTAVALMTGNKARNYKKAIVELEKIRGFKDTDQKIEYCNNKIEQINEAIRVAGFEKQNRANLRADALREKLPLIKKIALVVVPILVVAIVVTTVLPKIEWGKGDVAEISSTESAQSIEETSSEVSSKTESTEVSSQIVSSVQTNTTPKNPNSTTPSKKPTSTPSKPPEAGNNTQFSNDGFICEVIGDNAVRIIKYDDIGNSTNVSIPTKINGKEVHEIASNAFSGTSIDSVVIPSNIEVFNRSFENCPFLKSVTIQEGVDIIGEFTFSGCKMLEIVNIPSSVTEIRDGAFQDCQSLKSIKLPSNLTYIGYQSFWNCTSLSTVTIPSKITEIRGMTFAGCSSLSKITIPTSVKKIGQSAFSGCVSLSTVKIPNSVTTIERDAFNACGLTTITVPGSIKTVAEGAFSVNTKLKDVVLENGVEKIDTNAFESCYHMGSITIPNSITYIADTAFNNNGGCPSTIYFNSEAQKAKFKDYFLAHTATTEQMMLVK